MASLGLTTSASGGAIFIRLTAVDLDLTPSTSVKINDGSTVDPDDPNGLPAGSFFTSSTTGQGSVLNIELDGTAGPGVPVINPLLTTVTALTRTNTFPSAKDYQAGVLWFSKKEGGSPDARNEGLGVRAFTVLGAQTDPADNGLRQLDIGNGRALIEGSDEISGDTDDNSDHIDFENTPNGPDHVDEIVFFDFNPSEVAVRADSLVLRLSKLRSADDILDLHLEFGASGVLDLVGLDTTDTALFTNPGDDVWDLDFGGINTHLGTTDIGPTDVLTRFSVRASEQTDGGKSHFLINGFSAEAMVVPEPSSFLLLCLGMSSLFVVRLWHRRCRSRASG